MSSSDVRKKFLEFFKARGHAIIPSASLVPENDPTTLFTGSGMQPLVPYLLGAAHPKGKRVANSQKSFRTEDIDEVGDNRHTTFFEMLGNWSLGDYWKQEQLSWFFEFLTKEIGIAPKNLYVTVFSGGEGVERDKESIEIWQKLFAGKDIKAKYAEMGTEEDASEKGMQADERIFGYGVKKNWWSRAGVPSKMPVGEPGGPDSEVFYDFGTPHDIKFGKKCHPNCNCGRFVEIGNSVFMEFKKRDDGNFEKLPQRNVDFGGGLERITAASNNDLDIFNIDIFNEAKSSIEVSTEKKYEDNEKEFRIILDHIRASVFLLADGVTPSNTERGYVLRRLLRRAILFADKLRDERLAITNRPKDFILYKTLLVDVADIFVRLYGLTKYANQVTPEIEKEEKKFRETLARGMREFEKVLKDIERWHGEPVSPRDLQRIPKRMPGLVAFNLFTTYGFPIELTREIAEELGVEIDMDEFQGEMKKHQELSRTASAGIFRGGLADNSEKTTRLHTAHHLLLKALQIVLGPQVKQRGSNITSERLRMDFSYDTKMTEDQKKEVERIVNEKIAEDLPVIRSEIAREEAEKLGAEHEFGQKYPDRVSVYSVGPKSATQSDPQFDKAFSIEFCGGPHVTHTGLIGKFRIAKEEAVGAGIRRVRGVLYNPGALVRF